jgi:hypothetical protein
LGLPYILKSNQLVITLREFGFKLPGLIEGFFTRGNQIVRMSIAAVRLKIATSISGVSFEECYQARVAAQIDGAQTNLTSLKHLKIHKPSKSLLRLLPFIKGRPQIDRIAALPSAAN